VVLGEASLDRVGGQEEVLAVEDLARERSSLQAGADAKGIGSLWQEVQVRRGRLSSGRFQSGGGGRLKRLQEIRLEPPGANRWRVCWRSSGRGLEIGL
jgi:hypothetical protein